VHRQQQRRGGLRPLRQPTDTLRQPAKLGLLVLRHLADGVAGTRQFRSERLRSSRDAQRDGSPVDVGPHERDLRVDGQRRSVRDNLERLDEAVGGREGEPRCREGVQLPLTLRNRHQPDPTKVWSKPA
jgi:hypothetical protein